MIQALYCLYLTGGGLDARPADIGGVRARSQVTAFGAGCGSVLVVSRTRRTLSHLGD